MVDPVCSAPFYPAELQEKCGYLGGDKTLQDKVVRTTIFTVVALAIAFFVSQGCVLFFTKVMVIDSKNVLFYAETVPVILAIAAIAINWLLLAAEYFNTN